MSSEVPRRPITGRWVTVIVALLLVALGLFPAPLILFSDPAWQSSPVVRQLVDEQLFWIVGLVIIVAPVVGFAYALRQQFDETWDVVHARVSTTRDGTFMLGAAAFAIALAVASAVFVFSLSPTTSDEVAQLWHARMLLTGHLSLPVDPNSEFFAIDNVVDQGRWYSQFPIGGPVFLAVAMAVRATWLLNPLLAGCIVVNVYRFARRAYGADEARLAALLAATCPYLLILSGSYMNHTLVAYLVTFALAELPGWMGGTDRERRRASIVIGLSLGIAVTVRPLDGAIAAVVVGGLLLQQTVVRRRFTPLVITVVAGALPIAGLLVANSLTTGHPLRFGYDIIWGPKHSLGFHIDPLGNQHTPKRAFEIVIAYLVQVNWSLFGWPIAGIVIVAGALLAIGPLSIWEALLIAWIAGQLCAYGAYFGVGLLFGPRYLFTVFPAFLLLTARGIVVGTRRSSPGIRRSLIAGVGAATLTGFLIVRPPYGVIGAGKSARAVRTSFKRDLDPAFESLDGKTALVFVSEPASNRLARRLWSVGISRPDAIRLATEKDNCALLDGVIAEMRRAGSPQEHLARLEQVAVYAPTAGAEPRVPDPAFRISNDAAITPACRTEAILDRTSGQAISFGPALLRNEIGPDGRIAGPIVVVADMGEHNEVLRARFGDRPWYRLRLRPTGADSTPRLVPY